MSLSNCASKPKFSVVGASSVADAAVTSREAFFLAGMGVVLNGAVWRERRGRNRWGLFGGQCGIRVGEVNGRTIPGRDDSGPPETRPEKRTWGHSETIHIEGVPLLHKRRR